MRNPSYLAAVAAVIGQGLILASTWVLIYACGLGARVPPLRRDVRGADAAANIRRGVRGLLPRRVPRWVPRVPRRDDVAPDLTGVTHRGVLAQRDRRAQRTMMSRRPTAASPTASPRRIHRTAHARRQPGADRRAHRHADRERRHARPRPSPQRARRRRGSRRPSARGWRAQKCDVAVATWTGNEARRSSAAREGSHHRCRGCSTRIRDHRAHGGAEPLCAADIDTSSPSESTITRVSGPDGNVVVCFGRNNTIMAHAIRTTPRTGSNMRRSSRFVIAAPRIAPGMPAAANTSPESHVDASHTRVGQRSRQRIHEHDGERDRGQHVRPLVRIQEQQEGHEHEAAAGPDQRPESSNQRAHEHESQRRHEPHRQRKVPAAATLVSIGKPLSRLRLAASVAPRTPRLQHVTAPSAFCQLATLRGQRPGDPDRAVGRAVRGYSLATAIMSWMRSALAAYGSRSSIAIASQLAKRVGDTHAGLTSTSFVGERRTRRSSSAGSR